MSGRIKSTQPFVASDPGSLHARIVGLVFACPFGPDNPPDCPLHAVRTKPISERLAWVESLSPSARMEILQHHCACLANKEAAP
jgi:hypothetical protein